MDAKKPAGFTLMELLIVVAILGLITAAAASVFRTQNRAHTQQQLLTAMEENLRIAMAMVKDDLRRADYGVPSTLALTDWVPNSWFTNFNSNPLVVQGAGASPDTISIAACTTLPVAALSAAAAAGANTLSLTYNLPHYTAASLDTASRRLIRIGDDQFAWVRAAGNPITIDTNPPVAGNQGLTRPFFTGTPVCRVDIATYDINTASGVTRLRRNLNQGGGFQNAAEEITNLQITVPGAGRFRIVLTGRVERNYPGAATRPTRSIGSDVTLKN